MVIPRVKRPVLDKRCVGAGLLDPASLWKIPPSGRTERSSRNGAGPVVAEARRYRRTRDSTVGSPTVSA